MSVPETKMVWYRVDAPMLTTERGGKLRLEMEEFEVLKITPKGVWLKVDHGVEYGYNNSATGMKFVRQNAVKRFAYPTKELALESFKIRKKRYKEMLEWRMKIVEQALLLAEQPMDTWETTQVWVRADYPNEEHGY